MGACGVYVVAITTTHTYQSQQNTKTNGRKRELDPRRQNGIDAWSKDMENNAVGRSPDTKLKNVSINGTAIVVQAWRELD